MMKLREPESTRALDTAPSGGPRGHALGFRC